MSEVTGKWRARQWTTVAERRSPKEMRYSVLCSRPLSRWGFGAFYNLEEKDHHASSSFLLYPPSDPTASQALAPLYTSFLLLAQLAIVISLYRIDAHTTCASNLLINFSDAWQLTLLRTLRSWYFGSLFLFYCMLRSANFHQVQFSLELNVAFGTTDALSGSIQSYWLPITLIWKVIFIQRAALIKHHITLYSNSRLSP